MDKIKVEFKDRTGIKSTTKDLKDRFCYRPFMLMEIHSYLDAYPCCPDWLPVKMGNLKNQDFIALWNSENMKEVRRSILDGSFKYCDQSFCPYIMGNNLPTREQLKSKSKFFTKIIDGNIVELDTPPLELALCYDKTCNLSCPSCRINKESMISGPEFDMKMEFTERVVAFLDQYANLHPITLRVTGSGDPIASHIFLNLLKRLNAEKHTKLRIILQTNGTMLTEKIWSQLKGIHSLIDFLSISIDAATEKTYKIVRRGGSWPQLQKNLQFLAEVRKENKVKGISFNFVVQDANYMEIPAFVEMAQRLQFVDQVFFTFLGDWKTWSPEEFEKQCVWKEAHPNYSKFLKVLTSPVLNDKRVFLGNLADYRDIALKSGIDRPVRQFFMKFVDRVSRRDKVL